jgi:hypothetical protein
MNLNLWKHKSDHKIWKISKFFEQNFKNIWYGKLKSREK